MEHERITIACSTLVRLLSKLKYYIGQEQERVRQGQEGSIFLRTMPFIHSYKFFFPRLDEFLRNFLFKQRHDGYFIIGSIFRVSEYKLSLTKYDLEYYYY